MGVGSRCLQLLALAPAQFMSPSLRADGKYYDADDEAERGAADTEDKTRQTQFRFPLRCQHFTVNCQK